MEFVWRWIAKMQSSRHAGLFQRELRLIGRKSFAFGSPKLEVEPPDFLFVQLEQPILLRKDVFQPHDPGQQVINCLAAA
jgi:hypothetical protein